MKTSKIINNNYFTAQITGEGEPILCLAGFGCDHYLFENLRLNGKMIKLDNRGMGSSENNLDHYSITDLAFDSATFMQELGYNSYHVVGISMGGFIAQELAMNFSSRVKTLSLLCTTSGGDSFFPMEKMSEQTLRSFYALPTEKAARLAVDATIYDKSKLDDIVKLRIKHPAKLEEVLKQKYAVDEYLVNPKALYLIKAPTLIMSGKNDRLVNPKNSKILSQKIENSYVEFIDKSDHLFFLEKSELVSNSLNTFIFQEHNYDIA